MLPTTATPAVALAALGWVQLHESSFGGFRLSPKPSTRWDEGSSSRCSRRKREAQSCQPISPAVQQYSLTPTASRKSTKTIKSTRLTIRRRTRRIQSEKSPVENGPIRLVESDCIRNGLYEDTQPVRNTRERSITHSLQRWVSTKSSISQLECILIFIIMQQCQGRAYLTCWYYDGFSF